MSGGGARGEGRRWLAPAIGGLALAGLAGFTALRWSVSADMTSFLAEGDDQALAAISRDLADSELTRSWILTVGAGSEGEAVAAARELEARLAEAPGVAWIRRGGGDEGAAIHALYFPRRFYFWSDAPAESAAGLDEAGLRGAARELLRQLSLPQAALVKQIAAVDPLLIYPAILRRLAAAEGGALRPVEDQLVSADGQAVVLLTTAASHFDSEAMAPLAAAIDAAAAATTAGRAGVTVEQSAVARHALAAERAIRGDVARISAVSAIGIVGLFAVMFRSIRLVALVILPLAFGVAAAAAATLWLFGQIHGITLAFGATILGVAIDYSVHLFNHHMLDGGEGGAAAAAREVGPGLALGALTTAAGFAGLALTSLPGLREMATFAGVGVLGALLCARFVLPPLLPARPRPGRAQAAAARALTRLVEGAGRRRRALWVGPAAAAVILAIGLPRAEFDDDVRGLSSEDPTLLAEDERVRARVSRMDAGRLVIAVGDDEEAALQANDAAARALEGAAARGAVESYRSLHALVWSRAAQEASLAALRGDPELPGRLQAAFEAEGFRGEALEPFAAALAEAPPPPLGLADLEGTALAGAARAFRAAAGERVAIVTMLRGVRDPAAVAAAVEAVPGVRYFDQAAVMAAAYQRYRERTGALLAGGLVAMMGLLFARYRRVGVAVAALAPAVLAAATTVAILGIAGAPLTLLHAAALLLVLCMGVDYGVFLAESRGAPGRRGATLLSLAIACASTVLAFGLLAMSSQPALRALGVTVGLGVLLSLVFAPLTSVLAERTGER